MEQHTKNDFPEINSSNKSTCFETITTTTTTTTKCVDRQWLSRLLQSYSLKHDNSSCLISNNDPILRNKALVVAPMVDQSDRPFRLLCRKYGANLAYTPMIHAGMFVSKPSYRSQMWNLNDMNDNHNDSDSDSDRPLIAQLCGSNPDILLQAAKLLEPHVDAIDLNCGCPTQTAKKGRYGAFLLQSGDHLVNIVRYLAQHLSIPLTIKVRFLPKPDEPEKIDFQKSLSLYEKLVNAGISLLTIHGRTRFQKGSRTGTADWSAIQKVAQCLGERIPILANGNIQSLDDVRKCILQTGVDGVMSSESILEYPPLFTETNTQTVHFKRTGPGRLQIAKEYLDFCQCYPPEQGGGGSGINSIRMHIDTILHADWSHSPELQETLLYRTKNLEQIYDVLYTLEQIHYKQGHRIQDEKLSWYVRHRTQDEI